MAEELTAEEEAKAKELEQGSKVEKTQLEKIGDDVTNLTDMVKSQSGEKEKEDPEKKDEGLDMKLNAEEMAKSITEAKPEDAGKFIKELMIHCNVGIEDIFDEDGERYFPEEFVKSLKESEDETKQLLNGVIEANKAQHERYAKAFDVMMNLTLGMTKSFGGVVSELTEMKKSLVTPDVETETEVDIPSVGEDAAKGPKSQDTDINATIPRYTVETMVTALNKAFYNGETAKYYKYKKTLDRTEDADLFYSRLDNSSNPGERQDAVAIFAYLG